MNSSCFNLLVLSNGHGEDIIAVRIIQAIRSLSTPTTPINIFALPIVGKGLAYRKIDVPIVGTVRNMPSGGFIYMDGKELMRDVGGGLVQLTWSQIQSVRGWVRKQSSLGNQNVVLAVGDIVPLLFAAVSGANYAFVGTAKSEYYVRDEEGFLSRDNSSRWEYFSGSIYHPWERWLMGLKRCRAVFPRDALTTEILQQFSVRAVNAGNPMMDGLESRFIEIKREDEDILRPLMVTLLPGSRSPEAYDNWRVIMAAVSSLINGLGSRKMMFLGAIAPGLDCGILSKILEDYGWNVCEKSSLEISDPYCLTFQQKDCQKQDVYLILTQSAYNDCLHLGDVAIAMAGTATEQFIGLGKPAIAIPGQGPQYNPGFAEAQSRLLGLSLILINKPIEINSAVESLLNNPELRQKIFQNGQQRMGKPGAALRIAECLQKIISDR